jgi:translation elongation factor aEF-1 beta
MAQIVATMKIFPREIMKDFSNIKELINKVLPKGSHVYKFEEEPIAFGLVALIAHIVMEEDTGGEMEKVEEALKTINDIDEVEVLLVRRI